MLGIGHQRGLMVGSSVDGANSVHASSEAAGDVGGEDAILGDVVQTLEEGEGGGIERLGRLEGGELLDDNVTMTNENSIAIDLLGSGIIVGLGIDEISYYANQNLKTKTILVKLPVSMLTIFIWTMKGVFSTRLSSPFLGNTNLLRGALSRLMIRPICIFYI